MNERKRRSEDRPMTSSRHLDCLLSHPDDPRGRRSSSMPGRRTAVQRVFRAARRRAALCSRCTYREVPCSDHDVRRPAWPRSRRWRCWPRRRPPCPPGPWRARRAPRASVTATSRKDGNGGYDVSHYAITDGYHFATGELAGRTRVTATALQDLSRFDLDLVLTPTRVTVDGEPAAFTHGRHELVVTPRTPIPDGSDVPRHGRLPRPAEGDLRSTARRRSSTTARRCWPSTSRTARPGGSRPTTTPATGRPTRSR